MIFASFIQSFIHHLLGTYSILEAWLGVGNAEMDIVFPSDNSESGLSYLLNEIFLTK